MISNSNLIFKSESHADNFYTVMKSEYPNIYNMLCTGKKVRTFEIAYYYILSSFLESEFLLDVKTNVRDHIHEDFLMQSENILLDFADQLIMRNIIDLSVFDRITDDDQVMLKMGFDIAYDELAITTDVFFDVISTAHQREIELTQSIQDYELER